jgi:hypothetical protein
LLVEGSSEIVPWNHVASAPAPPSLLVGRVEGDSVKPCAKGGGLPEGVDLADRRPQDVLHDLFGVSSVASDPDRLPIDAIAVGFHERLRGRGVPTAQPRDEVGVPIAGHAVAVARRFGEDWSMTGPLRTPH